MDISPNVWLYMTWGEPNRGEPHVAEFLRGNEQPQGATDLAKT